MDRPSTPKSAHPPFDVREHIRRVEETAIRRLRRRRAAPPQPPPPLPPKDDADR